MRCSVMLVAYLIAASVLAAQEWMPTGTRPAGGALRQFVEAGETPVTQYRAKRTLSASSRGGKMRAELVAWTALDPDHGFTWSVIEERGSGLIRGRVLKAALNAEARLSRKAEATRGSLSTANYQFEAADMPEDGHVRVGIRALRHDTMLLNGSLLLTRDGDLVSVEGHLVKRPSFWTRKVWVTRDYGRVAGVRVPLRMTSRADVLMAGQSDFEMIYEYESVNGQPVDSPGQPVTVSASSE